MNLIDENYNSNRNSKKVFFICGIGLVVLICIIIVLLVLVTAIGGKEIKLSIDGNKPKASRKQRHFEQRKELAVGYTLKPQQMGGDELLWAISLEVDEQMIDAPRSFLQAVLLATPYHHYDPKQHCFSALDDAILQQLQQIIRDEQLNT